MDTEYRLSLIIHVIIIIIALASTRSRARHYAPPLPAAHRRSMAYIPNQECTIGTLRARYAGGARWRTAGEVPAYDEYAATPPPRRHMLLYVGAAPIRWRGAFATLRWRRVIMRRRRASAPRSNARCRATQQHIYTRASHVPRCVRITRLRARRAHTLLYMVLFTASAKAMRAAIFVCHATARSALSPVHGVQTARARWRRARR